MRLPKEWDGKFTIVVEDDGMDSGCLYDILMTCLKHGNVLEARTHGLILHGPDKGKTYDNDVMHIIEGEERGPIAGKC